MKLSLCFLYLLWPRHRGDLELREEGLAVLCCWQALGSLSFGVGSVGDSSGLGEGCAEPTKGRSSTAKLIALWQK